MLDFQLRMYNHVVLLDADSQCDKPVQSCLCNSGNNHTKTEVEFWSSSSYDEGSDRDDDFVCPEHDTDEQSVDKDKCFENYSLTVVDHNSDTGRVHGRLTTMLSLESVRMFISITQFLLRVDYAIVITFGKCRNAHGIACWISCLQRGDACIFYCVVCMRIYFDYFWKLHCINLR